MAEPEEPWKHLPALAAGEERRRADLTRIEVEVHPAYAKTYAKRRRRH